MLDLLKHADELRFAKEALIACLEKLWGISTLGNDIWKVAEAAEKRHLDVVQPPNRFKQRASLRSSLS